MHLSTCHASDNTGQSTTLWIMLHGPPVQYWLIQHRMCLVMCHARVVPDFDKHLCFGFFEDISFCVMVAGCGLIALLQVLRWWKVGTVDHICQDGSGAINSALSGLIKRHDIAISQHDHWWTAVTHAGSTGVPELVNFVFLQVHPVWVVSTSSCLHLILSVTLTLFTSLCVSCFI